ncbi:ABC transporter ATP-binding protein [Nitratireductor kimnyeongensis]|uniref:ABC transporter ATP-binding protein n=1 Tax=Nitratireductor kimnyeongensis TaxID=430679 RepID=A0ABW0TBV4_9HYPH|nr:sn-glycerol-3-phosphate ABC transporter ATP-binding protein UgpC [Nitratireductor kimnyeongensis]QZZ36960.1 sn-glycerol-3-phosphate ABC transporter ATP-binding protein UgpC [Nitratireductor kimnyeongensis]
MATVSFSKIVKSFGQTEVIHGADIDIEDGEFVVFVGPSGCGKSTLLRMLAGLESVSDGEIRIGETVVTELAPKDRDVAMVFQNYALYPHMTVADNIGFPLKMTGVQKTARTKNVNEVAKLLGLDGLLDRYPRELSGGQRQRVAMGRAIIRRPSVFLFDEPLSNLDAALRVQMRREIKLLHKRLESTMIFVTHDQVEAMTMADRIVVLRGGRVEQIGTPDEIYRQPANTFVASFIGAPPMNVIEGTVALLQQGPVFMPKAEPKLAIELPADAKSKPNAAFLGIRPEDCILQRPNGSLHPNGCVRFIERSGPETQLTVTLGATGKLSIMTLSFDGSKHVIGDPVNVVFPPERLCLFDQEGNLLRQDGSSVFFS